jgi:hypothetical protein
MVVEAATPLRMAWVVLVEMVARPAPRHRRQSAQVRRKRTPFLPAEMAAMVALKLVALVGLVEAAALPAPRHRRRQAQVRRRRTPSLRVEMAVEAALLTMAASLPAAMAAAPTLTAQRS